ncbi:peroxide stress protein YaaA [Rhodoferax sp. AJA081-3]|uniref:peroxide stress protein YaaA n=1 Tax=Rhodoferax sp. AJA081-3 TaxID=2752316 RepID=UPI001ADF57BD|nr:peroxide stress protein YaaA [Rhodoferax sp. AJA081-3]QTN27943.1 peroxide stress protein YaaA [Rhodoferax sp. AJA081-3]
MLFLLSPAKSLDYETPLDPQLPHTPPLFVKQSKELIHLLRTYSPLQIGELMSLSDALSALNVARYQAWSSRATPKNARQAVLAFDGDVYGGLDARSLGSEDLAWAQDHVCILSGLYGVLRPLDLMQPYRLEMGTRLANARGRDLYHFWGTQIADYLNTRLRSDISPVVINLASQEYFKAVDTKALKARVVECVFEDYKNGQYKIISFFAKRARGLMARYAVTHQLVKPEQLRAFDVDGYAWSAAQSTPERMVFRRKVSS